MTRWPSLELRARIARSREPRAVPQVFMLPLGGPVECPCPKCAAKRAAAVRPEDRPS